MGKNLYQKLLEIRRSVPYLQKTNRGHQYNYVSASDVIGAVREKMDSLGVLLTPKITDAKMTVLKMNNRDVIQTELFIDFVWRCVESGEESVVPFYAQGTDPHEKGVGKALTYAEKYFFLMQFNIPTDEDDPDFFQQRFDNAPNYITSEQVQELKESTDQLAKLRGVPASNFMNNLGVNSFERITVNQFYHFRTRIKNWLEQAKAKAEKNQQAQLTQNNENNQLQQQEQNNQQQDNSSHSQVDQLNGLINQIANARNIQPQQIINALGMNKNLNQLDFNEFNQVKGKLEDWLTKAEGQAGNGQANGGAGQKQQPQQQNNPQQNQVHEGNAQAEEFTLVDKKEEKVPSGELIVKLLVEGRNKPIFARSSEAMQQTNMIEAGDKFLATIEDMGTFTFVKSIQTV